MGVVGAMGVWSVGGIWEYCGGPASGAEHLVGPFLNTHFPLLPQKAARDPWNLNPWGQLSLHLVLKSCSLVVQSVGKTLTWSRREMGEQEIF